MTQPIAAEGTEYVTQKSMDVLLQTLIDRIQESSEAHQKQVDDLAETLERKIEQGKVDNLTTMQRVMDDRFAAEEAKRKSDIESLKGELKGDLGSMNSKLDEALKGVSKITGLMESLPDRLRDRDERVAETHKRIESRIDEQQNDLTEAKRNVELLMTNQASLTEKASRLQTTIHGDPNNKDDAPSLFGKLSQIEQQVTQGFINVGSRLDLTAEQVGQVRADVARIQEERTQEKARWQSIRDDVKSFGKWLIGTTMGRVAIGAVLGSIAIGAIPELRPPVIEALIKLIQQSGGQ